MMRNSTIKVLNILINKLVINSKFALVEDVVKSGKKSLFEVIKYAVRKEAKMMNTFWSINAVNVAKTPRQLNYVASEVEYKLRKLFLKDEALKSVWMSFDNAMAK